MRVRARRVGDWRELASQAMCKLIEGGSVKSWRRVPMPSTGQASQQHNRGLQSRAERLHDEEAMWMSD